MLPNKIGSVKILLRDNSPGGKLYIPPQPHKLGQGVWEMTGNHSVADLKSLIAPSAIAQKPEAMTMMAAAYWEYLASLGIESAYLGVLDRDGSMTDVGTLLDRGDTTRFMVMSLAMTPHDYSADETLTSQARIEFHRRIDAGEVSVYVADAESIFRFGFPNGSSTYERIAKAAGYGDRYQLVATLDDTIALLDEIRVSDAADSPEVKKVLDAAGLDFIPNPGYMIDRPVLNFDMKFNPGGDDPYTFGGAQQAMHLDPTAWDEWQLKLRRNAVDQWDTCFERGLRNADGKTEAIVVNGIPRFTDIARSIDENRIMLPYLDGQRKLLLPTNKEIARAKYRELGVYAAVAKAKARYGEKWRDHLLEFIKLEVIEQATAISVELMGYALAKVANMMLGQDRFVEQPIHLWAPEFVPYASLDMS